MKRTAIIYARVSTARQADDGLPVDGQIEQCHKKAQALDADVMATFRDDGISGRTAQRPGFQAALEYCTRTPVDFFVVWSTSRFARNHLDAGSYKTQLAMLGTKVVYVSQDMGDSDDSWMLEAFTAIIDESYSRQVSKDTRRSMAKNAVDGFFNGGRIPFGFRSVVVGKRKKLEPAPEEVPVVRTMFQWYIEGAGFLDIATRLNGLGLLNRGRKWNKNAIDILMGNPIVIGETVYRDKSGEIRSKSHDAIIDPEVFMDAQNIRGTREPRKVGGKGRSQHIFTGILKCTCGASMTTQHATGRSENYAYYNCQNAMKGKGCRQRRIRADRFDAWLVGIILDRILTEDQVRQIAADTYRLQSEWIIGRDEQLASLKAEQAALERAQSNLYAAVEAGGDLNLADLAPRLRANKERLQGLCARVTEIESVPVPTVELDEADLVRVTSLFRSVVEDRENPRTARHLFAGLISKVILSECVVEVIYYPERLVNREAKFAVHSGTVRWLPDPATLRTAQAVVELPGEFQRKAA